NSNNNMSQEGQGMNAGGMPDMSALAGMQNQDGNSGGDGNQGGNDANALLAQQQALMAMAAGGGAGMDAGASRDALMNLLAKQGMSNNQSKIESLLLVQRTAAIKPRMTSILTTFLALLPPLSGIGGGMPQMGMMGGMGAMNGMQMGAMNGMQMGAMNGANNNANGGDGSGVDNNANNLMSNPAAFGGFNPAMGGFQGGFPMGMAGMGMPGMAMGGAGMMGSVLGNANLLGAGGNGGENKEGDGTQADAATSGNNAMAQQNMLMQQLLQQQAAGGLWQQYGAMQGAEGMMGGLAGGMPTNSYLAMLGQGAAAGVAGAPGGNRESGDTGVFQSGAIPDFAKSGKKSRPKKPKNKPKRPLSAYNIFFKDERANILANIPDKTDEDEEGGSKDGEDKPVKKEEGDEGKAEEEGEGDGKKKASTKKRKRVPHGKIGFESLAKIVGQRWKELPPDELEKYKKRAEVDMKRYRKEMEAYVQKQREGLEQSREHLEKLVDEETKKRYFGDAAP
ncbi:MAG: hypothetical protein SGILL_007542, partial [Bacillariaceae sp.]